MRDDSRETETGKRGGKKARVYVDEVKARHTTHWDLDVLPAEDIERLHRRGRRVHRWRHWRWAGLAAGVVLAGLSALGLLLLG